jgi:hypothetical protein
MLKNKNVIIYAVTADACRKSERELRDLVPRKVEKY